MARKPKSEKNLFETVTTTETVTETVTSTTKENETMATNTTTTVESVNAQSKALEYLTIIDDVLATKLDPAITDEENDKRLVEIIKFINEHYESAVKRVAESMIVGTKISIDKSREAVMGFFDKSKIGLRRVVYMLQTIAYVELIETTNNLVRANCDTGICVAKAAKQLGYMWLPMNIRKLLNATIVFENKSTKTMSCWTTNQNERNSIATHSIAQGPFLQSEDGCEWIWTPDMEDVKIATKPGTNELGESCRVPKIAFRWGEKSATCVKWWKELGYDMDSMIAALTKYGMDETEASDVVKAICEPKYASGTTTSTGTKSSTVKVRKATKEEIKKARIADMESLLNF